MKEWGMLKRRSSEDWIHRAGLRCDGKGEKSTVGRKCSYPGGYKFGAPESGP